MRCAPKSLRLLVGLATIAAAGSVLAGVDPAAAGSAVTNRTVAGVQIDVACLSATKCVVVGNNVHSVGDVVPVTSGVAGAAVAVKGSQIIESVSCVPSSGCVAIGRTSNDLGTVLLPISKAGKVGKAVTVVTPVGVTFDAIACVTATSCYVAGADTSTRPYAFVVGTWNGKKLVLRRVAGIKGSTVIDLRDISCVLRKCLVVGYAGSGSALVGVTIPVTAGRPGAVARHGTDLLSAVSCVSAATCYAAGFNNTNGLVQTLTSGKIVKSVNIASDPAAIACAAATCTVVGEENPPPNAPAGATFYGAVVSVTSGAVDSTVPVAAVTGYSAVAMPTGSGFVAVGTSANGKTSELTTG